MVALAPGCEGKKKELCFGVWLSSWEAGIESLVLPDWCILRSKEMPLSAPTTAVQHCLLHGGFGIGLCGTCAVWPGLPHLPPTCVPHTRWIPLSSEYITCSTTLSSRPFNSVCHPAPLLLPGRVPGWRVGSLSSVRVWAWWPAYQSRHASGAV